MTVSNDKKIATQKKLYLDELISVGDENQTCKNLGLDSSLVMDWDQKDDTFRHRKKHVLEYFTERLANRISIAALKALNIALQDGDRVTTNSNTTKQVLDLEGNLQQLNIQKTTENHNPRPAWAVKQGLQIHIMKRLEENISHSLATLIKEQIIPEDLRDQIISVLDKSEEEIQALFSGNVKNKTVITAEMLALIQSQLLGG